MPRRRTIFSLLHMQPSRASGTTILPLLVLLLGVMTASTAAADISHHTSLNNNQLHEEHRKLQQQSFRLSMPVFSIELTVLRSNSASSLSSNSNDSSTTLLDPDMVDTIHNSIERVASAEFAQASSSSFRYLLLGDLTVSNSGVNEETFILTSTSGVASFWGSSPVGGPAPATLLTWMQRGVDLGLLDDLQAQPNEDGAIVIQARFVSDDDNSDSNDVVNAEQQRDVTASNQTPMLAGVSVAGVAVLALFGLFLARQKRKNRSTSDERVIEIDENDVKHVDHLNSTADTSTEIPPSPFQLQYYSNRNSNNGDESSSLADDSFTVRTDENNATTNRSIVSMADESFQKDRPIHVRKDMLTSPWSGRLPTNNGMSMRNGGALQGESVLQPSYFSAQAEEDERQRMMVFQAPHGDGSDQVVMNCSQDDDHDKNSGTRATGSSVV